MTSGLLYLFSWLILAISCQAAIYQRKATPCNSKACQNRASEMLAKMNRSVNPCESFYDFACGTFMKQELSEGEISRSALDQANKDLMSHLSTALKQPIRSNDIPPIREAKNFYQSCMRTDLIDQSSEAYLKKFIDDELGGWPMINKFSLNPQTTAGSRLSSLQLMSRISEYKVQPLFLLFVANNPKSVNSRVIKIKQPQLLPPQVVLSPQYQLAYTGYVKTFLSYFSPQSIVSADIDIAGIGDLGNKLSMSAVNPMVSLKLGYKNMTIRQLQYSISKFPWKNYIINGVFKTAGLKLSENDYVLVEDWDYMTKMADIYNFYSTFNKKALDNFLIMSFVNSMAIDYMPLKYLQLKQNFMKLMTGVSIVQPRNVFCASNVNTLMSFVTSRMYIDMFFDKNVKSKVSKMTDSIIATFKESLDHITWMDAHSRDLAHGKVEATIYKAAYPDYILNDKYLSQQYNFEVDGDHYLKNGIKVTRVLILQAYKSLGKPRNRDEWVLPPTFVNPFYDRESNQIVLPAAVLNPPFYDENIPNYLNFGAIGSIIGHELTHGFDEAGRHFDKNGLFYKDSENGLWTEMTIKNYANLTSCMINQYNNYKDPQVDLNLNGELTLDENIADNSGVKQSYNAYKKWVQKNGQEPPMKGLESYTNDQMFFISMAQLFCAKVRPEAKTHLIKTDSHSPAEFRILGPTSNSVEFSKAFNCKLGQANDPVKKCSIW